MAEPIMVNSGHHGARSNRRQQILVGVLVVIAVAALGSKVLLNGGGGASVDETFPATPPAADATLGLPAGDGEPAGWPAPRTGRNPFKPLIVASPEPAAAEPAATEPVALGSTGPVTPAPPGAPLTPAPPVVRSFTLVDVYTDGTGIPAAKVRIDEYEIDVYAGQAFADYYRVLALERDDRCGVFLYGDQRFSLCAGESTLT